MTDRDAFGRVFDDRSAKLVLLAHHRFRALALRQVVKHAQLTYAPVELGLRSIDRHRDPRSIKPNDLGFHRHDAIGVHVLPEHLAVALRLAFRMKLGLMHSDQLVAGSSHQLFCIGVRVEQYACLSIRDEDRGVHTLEQRQVPVMRLREIALHLATLRHVAQRALDARDPARIEYGTGDVADASDSSVFGDDAVLDHRSLAVQQVTQLCLGDG